jgi:hypothetical protein
MPQGFQHYVRNAVRLAQTALARLSRGHRDILQRSEGEGCARSFARGLSYKAAFVLFHKFREAMVEELKGRKLGGEGKVAEIDGGYFGGYVKPANLKENRVDRRLARNQSGKKAVIIVRAQRRLASGGVPHRRASPFIHPFAHRQRNNYQRGRRQLLGRATHTK